MVADDRLEELGRTKIYGGELIRCRHASLTTHCDMVFSVYLPPNCAQGDLVPVLFWLSGLTCTDENFMQKAGAQRVASDLGIAIVTPDTSPRGEQIPNNESYDLGQGAGFYLNATQNPWAPHYSMYDYVVKELPGLIMQNFPLSNRFAISGHSMGGHGALTIGLKNTERYCSISAFSPIVNPINCPWGEKAFSHYLGEDRDSWRQYDSCELLKQVKQTRPILIDQGDADTFLDEQLLTPNLERLATQYNFPIELRYQQGYDHSYYFIATFIEEHLRFHAQYLFESGE